VTADGGDYTVHIVVGIDPEWRMCVLDLWRVQTSADRWIEAFCGLVQYWKPIGWAEEQGQGRRYNRIRRRLPQPIKTSRKWRIVSKRRYASRRW